MIDIFDISELEAYNSHDIFIFALLRSETLAIKIPKNAEELEVVHSGFAMKTCLQLFHGCCGALDFFQPMNKPTYKECDKPFGYCSGHYKSYGVNCQAACDSRLDFLYFSVVVGNTLQAMKEHGITLQTLMQGLQKWASNNKS